MSEERLKHLHELQKNIDKEMLEIVLYVGEALSALNREDLVDKLKRYTELAGQDIDLVYEYHDTYFGRTIPKIKGDLDEPN